MKYKYIADTYAWISYFEKGNFKIIDKEIIDTPIIVIAEICRAFNKRKLSDEVISKYLDFINKKGLILPLSFNIAKNAGAIAEIENLALVDAIIYSYVLDDKDACLLTGDEHFKGKTQIIFEK